MVELVGKEDEGVMAVQLGEMMEMEEMEETEVDFFVFQKYFSNFF